MNLYKVIYQLSDGTEGEEIVCAANRVMAFEVFKDLEIEDVVEADCYRVMEYEDDDE